MKHPIIITLLFAFATASFAQTTQLAKDSLIRDYKQTDFYKRGHSQRLAGWIMAGVGTGGLLITAAADAGQAVEGGFGEVMTLGAYQPEYQDYTGYYVASTAVLLTGVYLIIKGSANINKAKAATVFVDMERAKVLKGSAIGYQQFPVVGLRIRL